MRSDRRRRRAERTASRGSDEASNSGGSRAAYRRHSTPGLAATLGKVGERPRGPLGSFPVSELLILIGIVGAAVGFFGADRPALIVGIVLCALGVLEVTAREHFSGFRSHTTLLAAVPAAVVEGLVVMLFGVPQRRVLILAPAIPVFALAFWLLRKRFLAARQRRIAAS